MSTRPDVRALSTAYFSENLERTGEYRLDLEATPFHVPGTGEEIVHTRRWSGGRAKFLQTARAILRVLEPPPSDRILESLARIEKLLEKGLRSS